jgi:imidazole glycerol-phosphate synthase subunit HisF
MLKKRIVPCLDIKNGRTVKGTCFEQLRDAGNPVELARLYAEQGADELVFLDITATIENRSTLLQLVEEIAAVINIPFTVGGGIASVENARELVAAGADKISINSAAVQHPELISDIAAALGSQCVVLAIDTKSVSGNWMVYVHGGRKPTALQTVPWAARAEQLGAGEILLTSMNNDGVKNGYALDITIHFKEVFEQTGASAALAASIFHFGETAIPELKQYLYNEQIPVRWNS